MSEPEAQLRGRPRHIATGRAAFVAAMPRDRCDEVDLRFTQAGGRLHEALHALYGTLPGFSPWFDTLCASIGTLAARRHAELCQQDAARSADPHWIERARWIGYSAYVDRYAGTLRGVIERIPDLRELGVGYLHLLPFLRARAGESDGGFAVASFEEVEPGLGSMADLEALTAALRGAGISLCADLVLNHVADDHAWARAARAGDARYRDYFHVLRDAGEVAAHERSLGQVFPQTAPGNFTPVEALGGWVWTTFYPFQWDLNYAHPLVFAEMAAVMLRLANRGIEVLRLDSAPFLWKRKGTDCVNLPEVEQLLVAFRAVLDLAAPGTVLKAEAIMPTRELARYFGQGDDAGHACQLAYHSGQMAAAWASLANGDATLLRQQLVQTPRLPQGCGWISYVRCHDDIVWGVLDAQGDEDAAACVVRAAHFLEGGGDSYARGAAFQQQNAGVHGTNGMTASLLGLDAPADQAPWQEALARFALMYGLAYWIGMVPLVYMGDEFGQTNNCDSGDAARLAADGRWLQRPRYDLQRAAQADAGIGVPAATRTLLRQLALARRALPAGSLESPVEIVALPDPALLGLRRGAHSTALFNFAPGVRDVDAAALGLEDDWQLLWPGLARGGDGTLQIPAWGMAWWCCA